MADAIETQGFKFYINATDSPPLEIGEIVSFNGFDGQAAEIDVTHLGSTAKEFLMGLQDFGTFTIECNYLSADAGQQALRAAKASRVIQDFQAVFSDSSTASFQAYVLSSPVSGGVDSKVDGSFALRITGPVTFA